ncbi:hypothetical protein OVS_03250 [Mycoplasma ovis str. Michigan]|uniref:Lipoprotein n=1 Tax=Mycoplasma ovis str. Michigan TaxID=1415773 RepID=A0ABM5P217_9MOLU|nr:hypothetical protein [Mycoplasma ovis]AHC40403.1 hypothetical protein OVS_03250 [Mycoplasma ovis str. Michigan]
MFTTKVLAGCSVLGGISSIPFVVPSSSNNYTNLQDRISLHLSSNFSICSQLEDYTSTTHRKKNHKIYICPYLESGSYKPELIYHLEDRTNDLSETITKKIKSFQYKIEGNLKTQISIELLDGEKVVLDKLPVWIQYTGSSSLNSPELLPEKDCTLSKKDDSSNSSYLFRCGNSWQVTKETITLKK